MFVLAPLVSGLARDTDTLAHQASPFVGILSDPDRIDVPLRVDELDVVRKSGLTLEDLRDMLLATKVPTIPTTKEEPCESSSSTMTRLTAVK